MQSQVGVNSGNSTAKSLVDRVTDSYSRIFSVREIGEDIILRWMTGAILLGFFVTFDSWKYSYNTTLRAVEKSAYICWPFFQNCQNLIWMEALPYGYSQTIFFMGLFGIMAASIYFMYEKRWEIVHFLILFLFSIKIYLMLIDYEHKGNYDYYHNAFCIIYLFARHRVFFFRFCLVFFYFLSTASKIYPSWVLGEYFTALKTGLPIFPFGTEILMTNLVIIMEMIFSWFLLSSNKFFQRAVFVFFVIFHLYSGILVGYRYPATVLPALLILFGPWFRPLPPPTGKSSLVGWGLMGLLLAAQITPHLISGDEKLTLEGNQYGLYMFEANHQCYSTISRGDKVLSSMKSASARFRCDPYFVWFQAKNIYCRDGEGPVKMIYNHSVNGRAFREIVNEPDICNLSYKAFGHNSWIKDEKTAPTGGVPVQNIYQ
ncbi:MAG TPA: hypothetical protein VGV39_20645 [Mesorhizobium sp.]|jgi:hypothetical protein|uniref:hypothetical protein n=1 Tax=Mesorhizobium sp. TaxID=1871066 RepID=UPI002DDD5788|nr:hypothetical protein [Mesorhizobium sp.]HEV2505498.1 hypothetical protein [Mesorhizobium sp.]